MAVIFEEFGSKNNSFEWKKVIISLAGPLTNFVIMLAVILVDLPVSDLTREIIIYANILIIAFNLLPIFPLDGGRIVKGILYIYKGHRVADRVSNQIANIGAILLTFAGSIGIYYFRNIAILVMLVYLWALVIRENKRFALKERVERIMLEAE